MLWYGFQNKTQKEDLIINPFGPCQQDLWTFLDFLAPSPFWKGPSVVGAMIVGTSFA